MNKTKATYQQKTFFQTGAPLFALAIPILLFTLYCLLRQVSLVICLLPAALGVILVLAGVWRTKQALTRLSQFVRQQSAFTHKRRPPLTIPSLLESLRQEGFGLTEYPFGNYYACRQLDKKNVYHFFISNNDTPDCPEAEEYSKLFIQTVFSTGQAAGSSYLLNLEYGAKLEEKAPDYIKAIRNGFMCDKSGLPFGFRIAYDTQSDVLYCAEAVTNIVWHKSEILEIYNSELLEKLLL